MILGKKIKNLFFFGLLNFTVHLMAQQPSASNSSLPPGYTALQTDTARMRFLVKIIEDSLNEGQLTHVYDWAKIGLAMAEKNKVDTMKGIFFYDIGKAFTYFYNKYDSAIFYYKLVPPYFPDKMRKYNVFSIREIMDRYADLGNKDSSFAYMDLLKALIDTMPDTAPRKITLSQNIAVVYQSFGMYRTAIRYFQVAINGNRLNKNFRGLGLALANLGELYNQTEEYDKAITTSKEALICLADVPLPFMQTASNIADYYITVKNYDSALHYLTISNRITEKLNNNESRLTNQSVLARIYIARKNYPVAKKILDETVASLSLTDNHWTMCRTLITYADLDTSLKQYSNAKEHLINAMMLSRKNNFTPYTIQALQKLAYVSSVTGNYKDAYQYQLEYTQLKDSAAVAKSKTDLNDLQVSYQTLQKEQQITLLENENAIKTLQLQNNRRSLFFYATGFMMLLLIGSIVFYQRNQRNKIQAQKMKAELQTQVLRSQMNPHFIFNSLNSIENFIMQNEKRNASDYLNKFSRLMRSILDSSRNEVVPLAIDMEILKLYVELEQLRFNNKFRYNSYVEPQLLQGDYRVPSLLIQPYLENAIVHGIAHSNKEDLEVTVTAVLEGDDIKYTVQDNGIGRQQAAAYNLQNKPYHKSVGLKITEERIAHFNKTEDPGNFIRFTDITDEDAKPAGTRVDIIIKAA
jgi:tetratricopeptide (TPR) repeat protein